MVIDVIRIVIDFIRIVIDFILTKCDIIQILSHKKCSIFLINIVKLLLKKV